MGDGLRINNEHQHRSSSSLARYSLDGRHSERKLEFKSESDDKFVIAEERCLNLLDKLEQVNVFKKKRYPKKRSLTRVNELPIPENLPTIMVRTQPKKTSAEVSQQPVFRPRLDLPPASTRGYVDPATVEQHRMLRNMRGQNYRQPKQQVDNRLGIPEENSKRHGRTFADSGDGFVAGNRSKGSITVDRSVPNVECIESDDEIYPPENYHLTNHSRAANEQRPKTFSGRRKTCTLIPQGVETRGDVPLVKALTRKQHSVTGTRRLSREPDQIVVPPSQQRIADISSLDLKNRRRLPKHQSQKAPQKIVLLPDDPAPEDQPVVEIYNMNKPQPRQFSSPPTRNRKARSQPQYQNVEGPHENYLRLVDSKQTTNWQARRVRYGKRRYEKPTVASQMKQAGMRHTHSYSNQANIPFIISKSTAPSHNIGVNIQQVLNGLKNQQPLSGIPLTIAHHMGLRHIPSCGSKHATASPSLDNNEINVIKMGPRLLRLPSYKYMSYNRLLELYREGDGMVPRFLRAISRPHYFYTSMYKFQATSLDNNVIKMGPRLLRLPSYKYMSYNRLLELYREGDGMVPRFLRAISRPHYFYTSMYNLATHNRDYDAATSKGRAESHEAKQSLAEYTKLYREYEQVEKYLKECRDPELEKRRDELSRELNAREGQIRKVVQEYQLPDMDPALRATVSNDEELIFNQSTMKLNGV